jgi:hypothetical protein
MLYVDCCPWTIFTQKPISISGERSVPLLFGFATYFILAYYSSGLTAGGSCHGKSRTEEQVLDVVEDRRRWPRVISH